MDRDVHGLERGEGFAAVYIRELVGLPGCWLEHERRLAAREYSYEHSKSRYAQIRDLWEDARVRSTAGMGPAPWTAPGGLWSPQRLCAFYLFKGINGPTNTPIRERPSWMPWCVDRWRPGKTRPAVSAREGVEVRPPVGHGGRGRSSRPGPPQEPAPPCTLLVPTARVYFWSLRRPAVVLGLTQGGVRAGAAGDLSGTPPQCGRAGGSQGRSSPF